MSLLLEAGIFATINMIAKKETRMAKWVGATGIGYGLITLICGLIFVTTVPEQNQNVIKDLI